MSERSSIKRLSGVPWSPKSEPLERHTAGDGATVRRGSRFHAHTDSCRCEHGRSVRDSASHDTVLSISRLRHMGRAGEGLCRPVRAVLGEAERQKV